MDFKTLEKRVRVGLWIWGALIAVLCICGFVYSLYHPVTDPNAPLPPGPWESPAVSSSSK